MPAVIVPVSTPSVQADIVQASLSVVAPIVVEAPLPEPTSPVPGRSFYRDLIAREARSQNVPRELVEGVVQVESGGNALAVGTVGEVGLMQIRPQTARMLGFAGETADLFRPETNVHYAATYLAGAWRLAKGDLCRTLMKYRAGHGEERMSTLSVEYCRRVRLHLAALGSPLALAALPKADFVSPTGPTPLFVRTGSLSDMAGWRRRTGRRTGPSSPSLSPALSALVAANRTPLYRAMLGGRT